MTSTVTINNDLLEEARRVGKHKSRKQAVDAALQAYITQRKQLAILDLAGKIDYWPDAPGVKLSQSVKRTKRK